MSIPPLLSAQQGYRRGPSLLFAGRNLKGLSLALGPQSSWSQSSSSSDTDASFCRSSPYLPQFVGLVDQSQSQSRSLDIERSQNSPRPPHLQVAIPKTSSPCRLLLDQPLPRLSDPCPFTPAVSKTPFLPPPLCLAYDLRTPSDRTISTPVGCTIFTHRSGSEITPSSEDPPLRSGLASGKHSTESRFSPKHRKGLVSGRHSPKQYSLRSALPESPRLRFSAPPLSLALHRDLPHKSFRISPKSPRSPQISSPVIATQSLQLHLDMSGRKSSLLDHHNISADNPSWHGHSPSSSEYQTNPINKTILPEAAQSSHITTLYKNSVAPEELREANALSAYPRGPRNVLDNLVFLYSDPDPTKNLNSVPVDIADYDLVMNVAEECRNLSNLFPAQVLGKKQYVHYQWSHTSAIAPDLPEITQLLQSFYNRGKRVLVHCQCGVLRLACVIVAFYMQQFNVGVNEAYERLKQGSMSGDACDRICPNMSLIFELMEFGDHLKQGAGVENDIASKVAMGVDSKKLKR